MVQPVGEDYLRDVVLNNTNSLDVNLQDQTTRAFNLDFHKTLGTTTLASAVATGAWGFTAVNGHSIVVGNVVALYDTVAGYGYSGVALVVAGDVITMDVPANGAFAVESTIISRSIQAMNVDGSGTRQVFVVSNPFAVPEDITMVCILMTCAGIPELGKFGNLAALARGVVFRIVNGQNVNYFNIKTNADLLHSCHGEVDFYEATKHGVDGINGRMKFSGPENHGVTLRLMQGDSLAIIVQDDLRNITSLMASGVGHETSGEA